MANLKFQNAMAKKAQNTPPVWFMRQAGRYHRHYQKLKEKYDFMTLCKEPELAAQVAMGPIEDFDFDIAILFSDLLFPLQAMGMDLTYDPGPHLGHTLTEDKLADLLPLSEALPQLEFQRQALRATKDLLPKDKSLIGFVGGPWTLFTYAAEGAHSGALIQAKTHLELYRRFSEVLLPLLKENIRLQLDGGAEAVMIFDTAAGELSSGLFQQFIALDVLKLAEAFPGRIGYYTKGTVPEHLDRFLSQSVFAGFGVDHRWDLTRLFDQVGAGFVQGNFDQALLFCDEVEFKKQLANYLEPFRRLRPEQRRGWVCGLGHGVLPKTPEKNVSLFVDTIREVFQ